MQAMSTDHGTRRRPMRLHASSAMLALSIARLAVGDAIETPRRGATPFWPPR